MRNPSVQESDPKITQTLDGTTDYKHITAISLVLCSPADFRVLVRDESNLRVIFHVWPKLCTGFDVEREIQTLKVLYPITMLCFEELG